LGFSTPTEAAAVGTMASIIFAFLSKRLDIKNFIDAVAGAISFSCMVMLLVIGGALLGKLFSVGLIPQKLGAVTAGLEVPNWLIIIAIQVVIFVGGFVIEGCALITILTPVFLPVILVLNFDPIVFGVAFMLNLATAVITPPFAANLYVMDRILPEVPFIEIAKGALIFLIADLLVLLLVLFFPQLSLWLPSLMK
jgi:TRAP-type C4-dicarboxylate transport system permease large subunit